MQFPFVLLAGAYAVKDVPAILRAEGSAIEWALSCRAPTETCANVERALLQTSGFIENALALEPIRISVKFEPFCDTPTCVIVYGGLCRPSQMIPVAGPQTLLYPQALFKQEPRKETPVLDPFDMYIQLNADVSFVFLDDYPMEMEPHHISFMDTLFHEVNHGLGFYSCMETATSRLLSKAKLLQPIDTVEILRNFSIYDKSIAVKASGTPLLDLVQPRAQGDQKSPNQVLDDVAAAIRTPGQLYFAIPGGGRVVLDGAKFGTGQGLSHLDATEYRGTLDMIMRSERKGGVCISQKFRRDVPWDKSPYSRNTLQILKTLGYKLNDGSKYENSMQFYYFQRVKETIWEKIGFLNWVPLYR